MDNESLASPTTKKLQKSMTEPRIPDNPQINPSSERIIPISFSPKPFTKSQNPKSNRNTKSGKTSDTTKNNDYYKKVSDIISGNNNNNIDSHENFQRRSLLVTLEDGSTTETLGSVGDIESDNLKRLQDKIEIEINIDSPNNNNNNKVNNSQEETQRQEYSHLLHR